MEQLFFQVKLKGELKNILYIWKGDYPWDVRTEKVCKAFSEEPYQIFMLCRWKEGQPQEEMLDGINIRRLGYNKLRIYTIPIPANNLWQIEIEKAISDFQIDLIIVREILVAIQAGKAAKKANLPIIMDMAENYPAAMKEWKKYQDNPISKFFVNKIKLPEHAEKKSVSLMDGIFVVTSEQIERLYTNYSFPSEKIEVVHNTPHLEFFLNSRIKIYETKTFFHHGNMTAEKRLNPIIEIFCKLDNNYKLVLAGEGECFDEYKQLAGNCDNIEFIGKYDYNQLPEIIKNVDVGVIPYQKSDFNNYTLHNKVFDFFAAGKPVILSPTKPFIRLIEETKAGVICDFYSKESFSNSLEKLLMNGIEIISSNALKAAEGKYNWAYDKKKLQKFIDKYLN